jgi:glycosyltransferase involved in cell wall biosynthesis
MELARNFPSRTIGVDARNLDFVDTTTWRLPNSRDRQRWWIQSAAMYPLPRPNEAGSRAIVWNPFTFVGPVGRRFLNSSRTVVLDLLDDWSLHYAFSGMRGDVETAYTSAFARADLVMANSEGTLALAHRFGRSDAHLITNGCDPDRFLTESLAQGAPTIGYVGKIGHRLDADLIRETCRRSAHCQFVFAGPILDRPFEDLFRSLPNVTWLGDVHYDRVPGLFQTFDLGWIPHGVGEKEVGGDVLKTYEYRAAGLPVLSTPILGLANRRWEGVTVLPASHHAEWVVQNVPDGQRLPRATQVIPDEFTWRHKAQWLLRQVADV